MIAVWKTTKLYDEICLNTNGRLPCSRIKRLDTVELTVLTNLTTGGYDSNEISSRFLYMH